MSIESELQNMTKRSVLSYAKNELGVELDGSKTKQSLIRHILSILDDSDDEGAFDESPTDDDKTAHEAVECESEVIVIEEPKATHSGFVPMWKPTYRKGDSYYYPISNETWIQWMRGMRDTHELKTIEYWIVKRGQLMVHVRGSNQYVTLR